MKMVVFHGARVSLGELWGMAKGNPLSFLIGMGMKYLNPAVFDSEMPHYCEMQEVPVGGLDADLAALGRPLREEIEAAGFAPALALLSSHGGRRACNLVFIREGGRAYIPLLTAIADTKGIAIRDVRSAILSFTAEGQVATTTRLKPQFRPGPHVLCYNRMQGSMRDLIDAHDALLRRLGREFITITSGNLRETVDRNEELGLRYFRSRGLVGDIIDR